MAQLQASRSVRSLSHGAARHTRPLAFVRPAGRAVTCSAAAQEAATDRISKAGQALAAAALALTVCTATPVYAEELATPIDEVVQAAPTAPAKKIPQTVYFGNGCFWGRQKDFVETEKALNKDITAVVGYAGGAMGAGPDGRVCYYYSDPRTVYERLGHAEVVKVDIAGDSPDGTSSQFRRFAQTYFSQFVQTPFGMRRLDPQDAGPSYRNVVGLPGGVKSPLFKVLQEENINRMDLREGKGNDFRGGMGIRGFFGQPTEDDLMNVVWIVDSNNLPFYQAEVYHQFHNGIGKAFPREYTQDLKNQLLQEGRIAATGCPELPF